MQWFLAFANFYRCFVVAFSKICRRLIESAKGDKIDWEWTPDLEKAFIEVK
jgi:hypothetical protein